MVLAVMLRGGHICQIVTSFAVCSSTPPCVCAHTVCVWSVGTLRCKDVCVGAKRECWCSLTLVWGRLRWLRSRLWWLRDRLWWLRGRLRWLRGRLWWGSSSPFYECQKRTQLIHLKNTWSQTWGLNKHDKL